MQVKLHDQGLIPDKQQKLGDASASRGMPKIDGKPPETERHGTESPPAHRRGLQTPDQTSRPPEL